MERGSLSSRNYVPVGPKNLIPDGVQYQSWCAARACVLPRRLILTSE